MSLPRLNLCTRLMRSSRSGKQLLERQDSYASVSTLPVYEIPRDGTAQP